jgi:hypothetical protein
MILYSRPNDGSNFRTSILAYVGSKGLTDCQRPNDGSKVAKRSFKSQNLRRFLRFLGRNRKTRRREAAGRRNYPAAVPHREGGNGENGLNQITYVRAGTMSSRKRPRCSARRPISFWKADHTTGWAPLVEEESRGAG